MSSKKNKKTNNAPKTASKKKNKPGYPVVYLLPIVAMLCLVPLLLYQYSYDTGLTKYNWFQGPSETWDLFLHCKTVGTIAVAVIMILMIAVTLVSGDVKLRFSKMFIPVICYVVCCIISTFVSIDRHYSLKGIWEEFEPIWMLLAYMVIVYYAYLHCREDDAAEKTTYVAVAGFVFMAIFGVLQMIGQDPIASKTVQGMILTDHSLIGNLQFNFEKGRPYTSMYNPDYIGFYTVLSVPLIAAMVSHKFPIWVRLGCTALVVALIAILYASQSRAGILVLGGVAVIYFVFRWKTMLKHWYTIPIVVVILAASFIIVNNVNDNVLTTRMKSMFDISKQENALEDITTDKDVTIYYKGHELHITSKGTAMDAELNFQDENGQAVATKGDSKEGSIDDERFPFKYGLTESDYVTGFTITTPADGEGKPERIWYFTNQTKAGESEYFVRAAGSAKFQMKNRVESGPKFLEEHYSLANDRGYIWSRTINVIKKYFWFGSGPDTFTISFPNTDLVGMYNSNHDYQIMTKPHCMFMQIAAQTGVPSLIALLVLFIWYILQSIRIYWKNNYEEFLPKIGLAVMLSVIGFLVLAVTNDSTTVVTPMFYALLGMGMGINHRLKSA